MSKVNAPTGKSPESIKIRAYSDVIYLYPTWIMAVICGLWASFSTITPESPGAAGVLFTLLFFFNLSIVAFDYTRLTSIVIILLVVILGLLSSMNPDFGKALTSAFDQPLFMNSTFYWTWVILLGIILGGTFIKTRFDYWELKNQELLHHHGILGDVERWPAPNLRISKEISDVLEFALLRSGRLVLVPRGEQRAMVIDNVPRINVIEKQMQTILNTLRVVDGD